MFIMKKMKSLTQMQDYVIKREVGKIHGLMVKKFITPKNTYGYRYDFRTVESHDSFYIIWEKLTPLKNLNMGT